MLSKEDLEVESIVKEEEQVKQCEYCGSTDDLVKVFGVYLCKPCRKKYRDGELRSK
jgi:ribosomal protein L37AE/L43A